MIFYNRLCDKLIAQKIPALLRDHQAQPWVLFSGDNWWKNGLGWAQTQPGRGWAAGTH